MQNQTITEYHATLARETPDQLNARVDAARVVLAAPRPRFGGGLAVSRALRDLGTLSD
jgi:hypothetical protein